MTQIATGPRGHQLKVSEHGIVRKFQHEPFVAGHSMLFGPTGLDLPATGQLMNEPIAEPDASGNELLSAVWRTGSYLETVQWELDAAQDALLQALRQAAGAGASHAELCEAANMTQEELQALLATAEGRTTAAAGDHVQPW